MKHIFLLTIIIINLYSLELQKAKKYNENINNISGWYMSEKLDGIRAYWNGKELLSKNGNKIYAPAWFIKKLPDFDLDGELWTKREDFENIQNIVLDKKPSSKWNQITYNIFEVPNQKGDFDKRLNVLKNWLKKNSTNYIKVIPQIACKDKTHLNRFLEKLVNKKAEGVILKNPRLPYFIGRSKNILKVKKFYDMEGLVIAYNYKKDKSFKSLVIRLKNGITFNLGNGFKRRDILNLPNIGEEVSFKYYGLTKYGKPKFASFIRVRKYE